MNRRDAVGALLAVGAAPFAVATSTSGGSTGATAAAGAGSLSNGRWTPARNPDGTIADESWALLPLHQVVEWAGTALESQLAPPYGAEGTFRDWGVEGIRAHFDNWAGAAFDEATGRFFCFGGGHAGSSNNMLSCFDARTGKWSVAIPPTPVEKQPPTYAKRGLVAYTQVSYPDGRVADNFVPMWSPAGDGRPTAMHTYGGLVFVKVGATEYVVKLRGGTGQTDEPGSRYWLANLNTRQWEKGGAMVRPASGVEQHATLWNGSIYWGMEGGQAADNQYWTVTRYDLALRKETGTFGLKSARGVAFGAWAGVFSARIGAGKWAVGVASGYAGANGVVVIDLDTGATESEVAWTGALVPGTYHDATTTSAVWIEEWGRLLLLDQVRGRWLEMDPRTGVGTIARIVGAPPSGTNPVYGRLRYWPARKVVVLHSRTMQNARVIRVG